MKARYIIPIIVTIIISGLLTYQAAKIFVTRFPEYSILDLIFLLSPLLIAIFLSSISGYLFGDKRIIEESLTRNLFINRIGLSATCVYLGISLIVIYSYLSNSLSRCEGYNCGSGFEPLIPFVLFCPPTVIYPLLIGACTMFFYYGGIKLKQKKFTKY